jgi:branched-chain amino acid aminotransferase
VIALLRDAGVPVYERTLSREELMTVDEVFSTGNYSKVVPVTRLEGRWLEPGPLFRQARALYWEFAHSGQTGSRQTGR